MRKRDPKRVFVGIDVSKGTLSVAWYGLDDCLNSFEVTNDESGHAEIIKRVAAGKIAEARVVMEATGPYGQRLFDALSGAGRVRVMVVRPAAAKSFARATGQRAKTDRVDAAMLAAFSKSVEFRPTPATDPDLMKVRRLSRHMGELIDRRAALMNQRHAAKVGTDSSDELLEVLEAEEQSLTSLIERLEAKIIAALEARPESASSLRRVTKLKGIKQRSAARLLPELLCLPKHLTPRQCVAFAGLDPRPNQSGTSRAGTSWNISKQGSSRIRRALFMAVMTAMRWFQPLRTYYERLRAAGKKPMVAVTASMRKLLTAIWAMVSRNEDFDEAKFSGVRAAA